jgi:hypothetical protein
MSVDTKVELALELDVEDFEVLDEEAKNLSITVDEHILRLLRRHIDEGETGLRQ